MRGPSDGSDAQRTSPDVLSSPLAGASAPTPTGSRAERAAAKKDGIGNVTKVLYIEHDDDNRYMLKTRLERVGDFEILVAGDSEKGCKLALTERPDVILMDLEMPVVDRWQPVRTLKNDPQTRNIPIIGMSAYALDSEREQAVARGATSSMSNRSSSSLWSLPFGASS